MNTKKEMMESIIKAVGGPEARSLVLNAYNAEIVSNRLSRMETKPAGLAAAAPKKDLLLLAIMRVHEVVMITH
ncbi:MAG TPA: hypothetical protein VL357_05040 [Rariglobus sp.]|jgi:hypothetical protein|nr:hypothetical protein [Rariglobus sp.]